jgi:hypothetical protein
MQHLKASLPQPGQPALAALPATSPHSRAIVPVTDRADLPAIFEPAVDRTLTDCVVGFWIGRTDDDRGTPELRRALEPDERARFEARALALRRAVAPALQANEADLLSAISRMLGGWPQLQRLDQVAALAMAKSYQWTVRNQPPWAILLACEKVGEGAAPGINPAFPLSEAQFAIEVRRHVDGYRKALWETEAVLNARVIAAPVVEKLPREEIEAKLGRPIGDRPQPPVKGEAGKADGKHQQRVAEDLERRRMRAASNSEVPA